MKAALETVESQRTLFSWADSMAEDPVKPKGRSGKPRPATLSMFEWALTLEQERGGRAGRREELDRSTWGEDTENRMSSPCQSMYATFFAFPA